MLSNNVFEAAIQEKQFYMKTVLAEHSLTDHEGPLLTIITTEQTMFIYGKHILYV